MAADPCIEVRVDSELATAMERARKQLAATEEPAALLRELALRGADSVDDESSRHAGVERLVAWSTTGEDAAALASVRDRAWR